MPHCEEFGSGQAGTCTRLTGSTGTHRLSGLTVFSRPDGDGTVVDVCGELDLATDQQLRHALDAEPTDSDGFIQLDLSGVEFCGCSALNILLHIRQPALARPAAALGPDDAASAWIAPPPDDPGPGADLAPDPDSDPDGDSDMDPDMDLRLELGQLRRAMESRGTIDLARGILMAAFALTPEDAWKVLVATSQHTNTKLRCLAEQVVDSARGTPLPEPVRKRLSAAVAEAVPPGPEVPRRPAG
ncbi:ANTAR domain-containing protein [Streptomyces violascens]|uniref:ANTAR domain-containing protein n=1 Tax=Streptomyces violascens TaxID=67381 RepID=UPI0037A0B7F4